MQKLTYFIDCGNGEYQPFYEYKIPDVGEDEFYARQLCTYFIKDGKQYQLISNEMQGIDEILVLEDMGSNVVLPDEIPYRGNGIHIEFRSFKEEEQYRLLTSIECEIHFEVIRYLIKDVVEVPGFGPFLTSSSEIDEDRGVYVIYVKPIEGD